MVDRLKEDSVGVHEQNSVELDEQVGVQLQQLYVPSEERSCDETRIRAMRHTECDVTDIRVMRR